jgi:DNA-binding FadR family transcriptional regulator
MFEKIKPSFIYHKIVDQIENAIFSDRLKPGDKLPPERELTEVFNTSRRTLREALRVLEQKGLIEIKTGSKGGAFVTDNSTDRMKESLFILMRNKRIPYGNLIEFRVNTEGILAGLATERGTREDIKNLKGLLREAETHAKRGLVSSNEFNQAETKLHLFLGQMSGNPLYDIIIKAIHDLLVSPSFKYLPVDDAYLNEAYRDWCNIFQAIEKKKGNRARTLMEEHVKKFSRYHQVHGELFDGQTWRIVRGEDS